MKKTRIRRVLYLERGYSRVLKDHSDFKITLVNICLIIKSDMTIGLQELIEVQENFSKNKVLSRRI
jgi:hypothetical protein